MNRGKATSPITLLGCVLLAACASMPGGGGPRPDAGPYDVVIEGGRIVDGTGAAWFYGDVALQGDRIARIAPRGALAGARAGQWVDATGMVVAPGFIDIQGHSRSLVLSGDSRVVGKVSQGVTTEIMGEGSTEAPANDATQGPLAEMPEAQRALAASFRGPRGFDAWLRAMESRGVSLNVGSFVGGSTLRSYGMGLGMGAATPASRPMRIASSMASSILSASERMCVMYRPP